MRKPFKTPRSQLEEVVDSARADAETKKEDDESDPDAKDLLAPMRMRGRSTDELQEESAKKATSPIESVNQDSILRTTPNRDDAKTPFFKSKSSPTPSKRERSRTENMTVRRFKNKSLHARPQSTSGERPKAGLVQKRMQQIQSSIKESQEDLAKRKTTVEAQKLIEEADRESVRKIVDLYTTTAPIPAYSMTSVFSSKAGSDEELSEEDVKEDIEEDKEERKERRPSVANKKEKKVAMVAREILSSERVYVGILKLIAVSFKEFLEKKKVEVKKEIIPPEKLKEILSNIPTILEFN